MNKIFVLGVVISILMAEAVAQSKSYAAAGSSDQSLFNHLSRIKPKIFIDKKETGSSRKNTSSGDGTQPEIVLKNDVIYFNARPLRLGESLTSWKKILPGAPRCISSMTFCIWDRLGIEVGAEADGAQKVKYLNLHLIFSDEDKNIGQVAYPDGRPAEFPPDLTPHHVFPGRVELDGFAIAPETEFWEIRKHADADRRLDCGLRDCSHPSGAFGDNAHLYLRLDGRSDRGHLLELSVDAAD